MITFKNEVFHLATNNISYLIGIRESAYLENLYFGKRIKMQKSSEPLKEKFASGYGNSIVTPQNTSVTLDNICSEYSFSGMGDFRMSPLEIKMPDGSFSTRFYYQDYEVYEGIYRESLETRMPHARKENVKYPDEVVQTLELRLFDRLFHIQLTLVYTLFEESDIITRRCVVINQGSETISIHKVMSLQLDLPESNYYLNTFDGHWARERHIHKKELISGMYVNDSTTGASSNRHNPLIILEKEDCNEWSGDCIGMNLIYSGNHYEAVEVSAHGKLRIHTGINPHHFCWKLEPNQNFYTPEAVLTFSHKGKNVLTSNFHRFTQNHIVSPQWAYKERPVLINNWEATYFDFSENKLLKLAKEAKELGIELFVLDDGWFGERNDDTSSLGDWNVNEKKLGGTLSNLVGKINKLGMQFGIWMEPEMISEKSHLFEAHPDWAVQIPNRETYLGRNQMVLDYTRKEVREYIVSAIKDVLQSANIEYVKWDMNRPMTEGYSQPLGDCQGEFYHRYILSLYEVIGQITESFPNILFESCSAGGNRFDLGMLYFMPQTWTSDNTDANERIQIQEGTSYGYPLSTMGAHVSAVPNHQTLRNINLETRFQVACFGLLGYELDLTKLNQSEKKVIKNQVAYYKTYRKLFQFGNFYRNRMHNGSVLWQVLSEDKKEGIVLLYQQLAKPNTSSDLLKMVELKEDNLYQVEARKQSISIKQFGSLVNQVSPVAITEGGILQSVVDKVYMLESEEETYEAYGDLLMHAGIKLKQQFIGTGYDENTRVMGDFSSRLYNIKTVEEKEGV